MYGPRPRAATPLKTTAMRHWRLCLHPRGGPAGLECFVAASGSLSRAGAGSYPAGARAGERHASPLQEICANPWIDIPSPRALRLCERYFFGAMRCRPARERQCLRDAQAPARIFREPGKWDRHGFGGKRANLSLSRLFLQEPRAVFNRRSASRLFSVQRRGAGRPASPRALQDSRPAVAQGFQQGNSRIISCRRTSREILFSFPPFGRGPGRASAPLPSKCFPVRPR